MQYKQCIELHCNASLNKYQELIIETMYTILATHSQLVLSKFLMFPVFDSLFEFIVWL